MSGLEGPSPAPLTCFSESSESVNETHAFIFHFVSPTISLARDN